MKKIGFVGCGRITAAVARGLVAGGHCADRILGTSRTNAGARRLSAELGTQVAESTQDAVRVSDIVVLAVDPPEAPNAIADIAGAARTDQLVISFVGSYRLGTLEKQLPAAAVMRAIPNAALAARSGVLAIASGQRVRAEDWRSVREVFGPLGTVVAADEEAMEVVNPLAGAGPALFAWLGENLIAEAASRGLSEDAARALVEQSVRGTGALLASGQSFPEIVATVASPGGITGAVLESLAEQGVPAGLGQGLDVAIDMSLRRIK